MTKRLDELPAPKVAIVEFLQGRSEGDTVVPRKVWERLVKAIEDQERRAQS